MDTFQVLLVEDNPGDARLIRESLGEAGNVLFQVKHANRLEEGLAYLRQEKDASVPDIDVVLLDLSLPDSTGLDSLRRLCAHTSDLPVLVLTGLDDEVLAVKALQEGAQDYLVKGQGDGHLLMRAIRYAIERKRSQVALQISEARYRLLAENVTDVIWTINMSFGFTDASPSIYRLIGVTAEELMQLSFRDILVPESYQRAIQVLMEEMTAENIAKKKDELFWSRALELEHIRKDQTTFWAEVKISPLYDEHRNLYGILGITRDITERKEAEAVLERRARELAALYNTLLEINSQVDLSRLLRAIVERACRLVDAPLGGIYTLLADEKSLQLVVSFNLPERFTGSKIVLGEGLAGQVARAGEIIAIEDYFNWNAKLLHFDQVRIRKILGIPLKLGNKVIGVLIVGDDQKRGTFSKEDIQLVRMLADQASIAIENARLLEAERQRSHELERSNGLLAALSQVASRLGTTLDPHQIMETVGNELKHLGMTILIGLFNQDELDLLIEYTSIDTGSLASIEKFLGISVNGFSISRHFWNAYAPARQRDALLVKDVFPFLQAILPNVPAHLLQLALQTLGIFEQTLIAYLPMVVKEKAVGVIAIYGNNIGENDLQTYSIFANQVAIAIENAQLYNEIQQLAIVDELTNLYNRRGFFTLAEQQMKLARREGKNLLLIFADVDYMKQINDTLGHQEGDRALVEASQVLRSTFRASDIVARMGGDEFAVLAFQTAETDTHVPVLLERLDKKVKAVNELVGRKFLFSMSIGAVSWLPETGESLDSLLARADAVMYEQKREKKKIRIL